MAAPASSLVYRRVPGAGGVLFNRRRLYVGPDHLLQVTSTGFSELYRRFFFHDIQVISLHKTMTGTVVNLIFGGLIFLFAGLATVAAPDGLFLLVFAAVFAVALGINIFRGPSCACYIQTAVQQQRLYSVNRIKRAQRLIEQLKSQLNTAQQSTAAAAVPEPASGAGVAASAPVRADADAGVSSVSSEPAPPASSSSTSDAP
jgi:hypothetical protein